MDTTTVPDVTVIIPVYNTVDYLRPCLDSLVGQTVGAGRLHVIAVDDGSTDGSGELLEDYAAAHPDLFQVFHQANSGGPAGPCNVGLAHATGRFVFFLGSDDYLALDAIERLVERADEWDADVVVPPAIGVNGRFVDQRLFRKEHPDLPFPGDLLSYSVSNTKLFRRSIIEEHGIRYPLDLRVGSDQPFAVGVMLRARRIGVLGTPHVYFVIKRADESNITYVSNWRTRLEDLTAVVEHVCDLVPAGDERDALLVRHFSWEYDKLLTRDLPLCDDDEAAALVSALQGLAQRWLTPGLKRRLTVTRRLRWHHLVAGNLEALRAGQDLASTSGALVVGEHAIHAALPGFRDGLPDEVFVVESNLAGWLADIDRGSSLRLDGTTVVLDATTSLVAPESAPRLQLTLSPLHPSGVPRTALDVPRDKGTRVWATGPVTISAQGAVHAELDLAPYLAQGGGRAGLRLRLTTADRVVDRPLRIAAVDARSEQADRTQRTTIWMTSSTEDRVLVEVGTAKTLAGRVRDRLSR